MKNKREDSNIVPIPEEIDDFYTDDSLFDIISWGADLSFREIITMYESGELLKPDIQRHYVWDKTEASRFIDSLLLGLPVPSIFLAREKDYKLIVDGFQRIMTVYDYTRGIFSEDDSVFKLTNSEKIHEKWRGKAFKQLNEGEQRKILSTTIHAIIFEQRKPKDIYSSLYQVFERINTSGRTLLPQEIRNCVYQGSFNKLLTKLNENTLWRNLYGLEKRDSRMRDVEFILRFFALASNEVKNSKAKQISLKRTLNDYMGNEESRSATILEEREKDFTETVKFISENLGCNAFHNLSPKGDGYVEKLHPAIFDSISIATSYALKESKNKIKSTDLQKKKDELLKNENYIKYISLRTTNIANINGRIGLALKYLFNIKYE